MASENNVQKTTWLQLAATSTLFRLNTGKGWISGLGPKGVHRLKNGSVEIQAPRSIALGFGLASGDPVVGAADLVGWSTVTITPEMVGTSVAVFTSVEMKASKRGVTSEEQFNWQKQVKDAGGIAIITNSPEEAKRLVVNWHTKLF